jgi:hypothetical protein
MKELEKAKSKLPPGTKLMDEEDRIRTLEDLKKKKDEVHEILRNMPLSMRTEALKN